MPRAEPNKRKLNDLFIRRLQPQAAPFLVWDTYQRGLAVQVQPTGHKAWKCIYKFAARPRWYHIADATAIGLTEARTLASQVMYQVAQGKDPAAERRAQRGAGTFEELATQYRAYAERKNKSWKQADKLVRRNLLPSWAKLRAGDITRSDVKALMARIEAPILANQVLASASAIFTWAIKEEVAGVKVNPCIGVERNKTAERERVLSDVEIPKFWIAFDAAGFVNSMALKALLLTGQRPGEVCAMRTEHIEAGWWTLPGKPIAELGWPGTKNGETHRVWLPAPALQIISQVDTSGFVFPGARVPALGIAMRGICKDLGVERATPHDLRRTHGTTITSLKFGKDAMNRIQNHKEGGIASVYDQYGYADENRDIMEAVARKIMGLVSDEPSSNVIAARFG